MMKVSAVAKISFFKYPLLLMCVIGFAALTQAQYSAEYYYSIYKEKYTDTKFTPQQTRSLLLATEEEVIDFNTNCYLYTKLEVLQITASNVTVLDTAWEKLGMLKLLRINDTKLEALPKSIANAKNIKFLDLGNNQLKEVPYHLSVLVNLEHLELGSDFAYGNNIKIIDERIVGFKNLKMLNISNNPLDSISPAFCQMTNLALFIAAETKLKKLPDNLGELKGLKVLILSHNPLLELPKTFTQLDSLQVLEIGHLPNCKSLNNFDFLTSLKQLKFLKISLNTERTIPMALTKMLALSNLTLYGAEKLDFDNTLAQLKSMKTLRYVTFFDHSFEAKQQSIITKQLPMVDAQFYQ